MKAMKMREENKIPRFFIRITFILLVFFFLLVLPLLRLGAEDRPALRKMYDRLIQQVALKHRVPSALVHSIIHYESNYNSRAVSHKGAIGLMQLMPETAKEYGVKNLYDPRENIEGGVRYLKDLIKLYKGKTNFVLAAYNAGQEALKKYGGIPPYLETRNYIRRIMAKYPRSTIRTRTKIYEFYDDSGKLILTNTPYYFSIEKSQTD